MSGPVQLPRGGIYLPTPEGALQFGAPSETLKDTLRRGDGVPSTLVLGRDLFSARRGVALADLEFPIYYQLFVKRRPLRVVGRPAQLESIRRAMQEALLGPAPADLRLSEDCTEGARVPDLLREWRYFRRGPFPGGELRLEHALDLIPLEGGRASLPGGIDVLEEDDGFAIRWDGVEQARFPAQVPLPSLQPERHGLMPTFEPPQFGLTMLGRSHGFDPDPDETTSGFVLWVGGRGIMVDPPVNSTELLKRAEIDPRAVEAVLLTHCHADHDAGTLQKALEGGTVTLYTTPTIFASYRRKWSALSGIPEDDFARLFEFRPVKVGARQDVFGAQFLFRFTLHSIPTIAFEVHYGGRSINYSSDTLNDPEQVQAIFEEGGLERERRDELLHFDWDHDLVLHEAGVPPLHTPLDVLTRLPEATRRRTRLVHTTPTRVPSDCGLVLAEVGREGTEALNVQATGEERVLRTLSLLGDIKLFRKLPLSKAAQLVGAAKTRRFAAGERFIEHGARGDALFLITAGKASVVQGGRELKVYGLGDYIGETAVFLNQPRNADVVAKTDLEVVAIDGAACKSICEGTGVVPMVRRHARVREMDAWTLLEDTELFSGMSAHQKNELETLLVPLRVKAGQYLTHEGAVAKHLVLVQEGVVTENKPEPRSLGRGDLVGEPGVVLEGARHPRSAVAVSAVRGFKLSAKDLRRFVDDNPGVRVRIQPWRAKEHISSGALHRLLEEYL